MDIADSQLPPPSVHRHAHTTSDHAPTPSTGQQVEAATMLQGDLDITWQQAQATFAGSVRFHAYANQGLTPPPTRNKRAGTPNSQPRPKQRRLDDQQAISAVTRLREAAANPLTAQPGDAASSNQPP